MKKAIVVLLAVGLANVLACSGGDEDALPEAKSDLGSGADIRIEEPAQSQSAPLPKDATQPEPLAPLRIDRSVQSDGTVLYSSGKYQVVVDKKDASVPDTLVDALLDIYFRVYERMALRFDRASPLRTRMTLDPGYDGVAFVSGTSMTISSKYIKQNSRDLDVVTHEAFHLVQSYRDYSKPGCPAWAAEGFADYARYRYGVKNAEAGWALPDVTPAHKPTDSYRVTGRFFVWLENRVRASIMADLHGVLERSKYTDSFWKNETGKSLDQLWADYRQSPDLQPVNGAGCVSGKTYCGGHDVFGAPDVLHRCDGDAKATEIQRCLAGCGIAATTGQDACR